MKIVFISDNGTRHTKIRVKVWLHVFLPILMLVGVSLAVSFSPLQTSKKDTLVFNDFTSILSKLSHLDAEVLRLTALSSYIAVRAKLDIDNFSLSQKPAMGGSSSLSHPFESKIIRKLDLANNVSSIQNKLEQQKLKLRNLVASLEIKEAEDSLAKLMTHDKKHQGIHYDFSTPLKKGYISSVYGDRRDPINGSLRHHNGLDIAAIKGTKVFAIANGFVTFRGKKGAYGNLLEINHSETLKSRYAHLDRFFVKKGQLVRKGSLIGTVGDTGRVTGPHLHLEIKESNKIQNPKTYLNDALKTL